MIFSVRVNWICHFIRFISHPMMCFIAEIVITRYPVIFGFRDGTGWVLEKVRNGLGSGIPSGTGISRLFQCITWENIPSIQNQFRVGAFVWTKCFFFNTMGLTFYFRVSQKSLFIGNQEYFDLTFVHISTYQWFWGKTVLHIQLKTVFTGPLWK